MVQQKSNQRRHTRCQVEIEQDRTAKESGPVVGPVTAKDTMHRDTPIRDREGVWEGVSEEVWAGVWAVVMVVAATGEQAGGVDEDSGSGTGVKSPGKGNPITTS